MKKLLLLSLSLCLLFSVTAQSSVQNLKIEKHKTEKVSFEAVVVSTVGVSTSKIEGFSSNVFVQRQCSNFAKEASFAFANLETQSFNYSRYWCRNYEHSNSIYNNTSIKKDQPAESESEEDIPV